MGDVLMSTPAIRALRESLPNCEVTLLTSHSGAIVADYVPEIDHVIQYESPWMKASPVQSDSAYDHQMIDLIRRDQFDAAVIFTVATQNSLPAALFCYLADIPLRLAYSRENPYHLLTNWLIDEEWKNGFQHEVQRQLSLVASIGCSTVNPSLSFEVRQTDRDHVGRLLQEHRFGETNRWIVIHPGATAPSRRYPIESFAQVADALVRDGFDVIITGDAAETSLVARMRECMGESCISLVGSLTLGQMGALIERTPLLLTNNTGPVHLAAALGTPVVDLYALTNPQHQPWNVPHRVLFEDVACKYCFKSICPQSDHRCLAGVSPESIVQAVHSLLAEVRSTIAKVQSDVQYKRAKTCIH